MKNGGKIVTLKAHVTSMVAAATRGVNARFSATRTRPARAGRFGQRVAARAPAGPVDSCSARRSAAGGTSCSLRPPVPVDTDSVPLERAGDGGVGAYGRTHQLERAPAGRAPPSPP